MNTVRRQAEQELEQEIYEGAIREWLDRMGKLSDLYKLARDWNYVVPEYVEYLKTYRYMTIDRSKSFTTCLVTTLIMTIGTASSGRG